MTIVGMAKGSISTTVQSTLARFDGYSVPALGMGSASGVATPPQWSDDGKWWWDGAQWVPASTGNPAAANAETDAS